MSFGQVSSNSAARASLNDLCVCVCARVGNCYTLARSANPLAFEFSSVWRYLLVQFQIQTQIIIERLYNNVCPVLRGDGRAAVIGGCGLICLARRARVCVCVCVFVWAKSNFQFSSALV